MQSSEQRLFRRRVKPQLFADGSQQENHLAVFGDARKVEHGSCRQRFGLLCSGDMVLFHVKHQNFVCQRVLLLEIISVWWVFQQLDIRSPLSMDDLRYSIRLLTLAVMVGG